MKNIRILHLFPKRLSLYGEYGNIYILKKALVDAGYTVSVDEFENGDLSLDGIDFIYVGSGTEDAIILSALIMHKHKEQVKASIDSGTVWLATGNAPALFGKYISKNEEHIAGLGVFPYSCNIESEKRYSGDVITDNNNLFHAPLVGFVNTSCVLNGMNRPLLYFKMNASLGNDKLSSSDGLTFKNFFASQLIGPILVKNPPVLQEICRRVTGNNDFLLASNSNAQKAYESAFEELSKRI